MGPGSASWRRSGEREGRHLQGEAAPPRGGCCAPQLLHPQLGQEIEPRRAEQRREDSRQAETWLRVQPRDVSKRGANSRAPTFSYNAAQNEPRRASSVTKALRKADKHSPAVYAAATGNVTM